MSLMAKATVGLRSDQISTYIGPPSDAAGGNRKRWPEMDRRLIRVDRRDAERVACAALLGAHNWGIIT